MAGADEIWLSGISCRVRLGVPDDERRSPQSIEIDLGLTLPLDDASRSDDVKDTADYAAIEHRVREQVESGEFRLVERLAATAAETALACDPRLESVAAVVHKRPALMPRTREISVRVTRFHSKKG